MLLAVIPSKLAGGCLFEGTIGSLGPIIVSFNRSELNDSKGFTT
jgi:hypothetical protein